MVKKIKIIKIKNKKLKKIKKKDLSIQIPKTSVAKRRTRNAKQISCTFKECLESFLQEEDLCDDCKINKINNKKIKKIKKKKIFVANVKRKEKQIKRLY